jgi:hypothetical protein
MFFFSYRTILSTASRKYPGYFFSFLFVLSTCKNSGVNKEEKETPRIAKTVPSRYFNTRDTGFALHQDTVLYRGNYFTGYCYSLYPEGDTEFSGGYFNGVEEGIHRKWYPGGQMAEERFYINGKKEGTHRGWWPGGKSKFIFHAVQDEYEGEFVEWYASGLMSKKFNYVHGHESGSQRLWWDNGTVRANYVVRNGKQYGLIGLTICANPYDSVFKK